MKKPVGSETYHKIGTRDSSSDSVPIPAPGIGTRIAALSDLIGTREATAKAMGVSSAALQRYIREENTPPFDAAARLCRAAGARMEWLASAQEPRQRVEGASHSHSHAVRLDKETLREATRSLIRVCAAYGFAYDPVEDVDLLAEFYAEGMEADGEISAENVIRLVERIAERRRAQEERRGSTDDAETEGTGRRSASAGGRKG